MDRREAIGGGLVAGVASMLTSGSAEAAEQRDDDDRAVADAIDRVRKVLEQQFDACELGPCPHIDAIRQQQRTYLKAAQKYPDFIEVGLDVWDSVYDWHIKHQQPIQAARSADGRYLLTFMFTNLVLRPDQAGSYVGFGFDNEPPPARTPVR